MHYYVKDFLDPICLQEALDRLPAWRREQALRFKHTEGQMECAFSYLLLCEALQREYGISEQPHFLIGEHGKPTLLEFPHVHFNMSHCKAGIAVAVSDAPVGIDIECIGRGNDAVARYFMSDAEYACYAQAEHPDLVFAELWTRKEAVVKLTGRGIDDNLKQLLSLSNHVELVTRMEIEKGYAVSIAQYKDCGK